MMYSVRKTAKGHGTTNLIVLCYILVITGGLIWQYGMNYFVIFCSSSLLHLIIETGLTLTGIRKGKVYIKEYQLPRFLDLLLRSLVEGPAFCVPAFFIADNLQDGNVWTSIIGAIAMVGFAAFYMGWVDGRDIKKLGPKEEALISRRAMTKTKSMILLALINTICIIAMVFIPIPYRTHAFTYLIAYSGLVLLFYFINYNLGVRYIEIYDNKSKVYKRPGLMVQIAGLTYDSAYEMALLISPAYWVTFYLGFFH